MVKILPSNVDSAVARLPPTAYQCYHLWCVLLRHEEYVLLQVLVH